jgi:hypothetical protein
MMFLGVKEIAIQTLIVESVVESETNQMQEHIQLKPWLIWNAMIELHLIFRDSHSN